MEEKWRKTFLMWAETEEYQQKVEEAEKVIEQAYSLYKKPYLAFSGGKDSTVLLHLLLKHDENIKVLHWDYGRYYMPRWLEREIVENAKRIGAKNFEVKTSKLYDKLKRNAQGILGKVFIGIIGEKMVKRGYDLVFIGLRAEESIKRKLKTRGFFSTKRQPHECYPIRNFTWMDVWAYIVKNNVPYASIYNKYANILGYDKVRLTTFFDKEFDKFGTENIDGVAMWRFRNL